MQITLLFFAVIKGLSPDARMVMDCFELYTPFWL